MAHDDRRKPTLHCSTLSGTVDTMSRTRLRQARHASSAPRAAPMPPAPPVRVLHVAAAVLLVLLVVAAFSPCLGNGFVNWDDDENFLENFSFRGLGWPQIG